MKTKSEPKTDSTTNGNHPPESAVAARFEDEIGVLAHTYYEEEGRPDGRAEDHWLRAEREIQSRNGGTPSPETDGDRRVEEANHAHQ